MKNKSDKKTETAVENLEKKFQQRADAHIFLGLADEQPRVDQFLKELDAAFKVAEEDVLPRITKVLADMGEVMEETASRLDECRETIKGALEKTYDPWPPDWKALRDLAYQVEAQLQFLHVMVRARTDKYLDRLSPHSGFMPGLLQIFADRYGDSAKDLPRIICLINPRDPNLAPLQGRSVAQAASKSLTDYVCKGKFFPLCLLRFYLWALRSRWRYRIRRVPLQDIADRRLPTRHKLAGHPLVLEWDDVHARTLSQLADLWRGIRYNLENTIKDLNARAAGMEASPENGEGTDGLKEMLDGLGVLLEDLFSRSAEVFPELESQVREYLQSILPRLEEGHNDLKTVVISDVSKSQNLEARFLLFQEDAFSMAGGFFTRLTGILLLRTRKGVHSAEVLKDRWQTLQGWVFRFLGVPRAVVEDMLKYSDLPSTAEADAFIESLPPVYRGLFSLGPLQSREFLVGRDKELETLGQLVKRWEQDLLCSVAVVGPAGSGKTSLLNCLENEGDSTVTVKRVEMTRRLRTEDDVLKLFAEWFQREKGFGSVTELVNYLRQQPRAVLIVEGGHNLVLRTGGGQRTVEFFLTILLQTREHFMWIMAFREAPWKRLDYLVGISRYFTHQVHTLFQKQAEIKEALLIRQRTSGYPLVFSSKIQEEKEKATLTQAAQQKAERGRENRFYSDLFAASSGNFEAAMYYWMVSVTWDEEDDLFRMAPLGRLDFIFLRSLDRAYLFGLAEIISHGGMKAEEFAEVFMIDIQQAHLILGYLLQLNLFQRTIGEGYELDNYVLNPAFFAPVTATLESMNILY